MPTFGLSFSHRRASQLGLDPTEAYLALLIHLKPRQIRLSLFWDEVAPDPGAIELGLARWYLDRAEEHHCRVLLTVGATGPGDPGFYPPRWLRDIDQPDRPPRAKQGRFVANLLLMLERAIAFLADYDTIDAWQVEPAFPGDLDGSGAGPAISLGLLKREVDVVREVDARHRPIVVNGDRLNLFRRGWADALRIGDVLGQTMDATAFAPTAIGRLLRLGGDRVALRLLAAVAAQTGKQLWITELRSDAAPRQSGARTSGAGPDGSNPQHPWQLATLARRSGAGRVYVGGAEWWLLMRERGDGRWWELAKAMLPQG